LACQSAIKHVCLAAKANGLIRLGEKMLFLTCISLSIFGPFPALSGLFWSLFSYFSNQSTVLVTGYKNLTEKKIRKPPFSA